MFEEIPDELFHTPTRDEHGSREQRSLPARRCGDPIKVRRFGSESAAGYRLRLMGEAPRTAVLGRRVRSLAARHACELTSKGNRYLPEQSLRRIDPILLESDRGTREHPWQGQEIPLVIRVVFVFLTA